MGSVGSGFGKGILEPGESDSFTLVAEPGSLLVVEVPSAGFAQVFGGL